MVALVLSAIVRIKREVPRGFALASAICGLLTAYLMNREPLRVHDEARLRIKERSVRNEGTDQALQSLWDSNWAAL